jgi:hypothetical protein
MVTISKTVRWTRHVARMREERHTNERDRLEKLGLTNEDNIKIYLKETGWM